MASWTLVPCLVTLQNEFDVIAPNRDTASDGVIGDRAHADRSSDHNPDETGNTPDEDSDNKNEVHAIDVDNDLRVANFNMEDVVQYILWECRKPGISGKDKGRLKNIIYNKRIWASSSGWVQKAYTGSSAHTEHVHFSAEYDSEFSEDTSPWGLITKFGDDVGTVENFTPAAINQIVAATTRGVLSYGGIGPDGVEEGGVTDLPGQDASNVLGLVDTTYRNVVDIQETVETLATVVEDILAKLNTLVPETPEV